MNGPALLALQRLDTELELLTGRRRRLAEHEVLAQATKAHKAWLDACAALRRIVDEASSTIASAESDGAALDTKQRRLEAQLRTVIAPREAEALMSEIATLRAHHSDIDDVELAAMERSAEAEESLMTLELDEERMTVALAEATTALGAALAILAAEEQDLMTRRAGAAGSLTDAELRAYDSIRARHDGVAISTLDGSRCTACHLDLSPAELDIIRHPTSDDMPDCPQCGRLIAI